MNVVNSIKTKADFISFIHFLLEDLKSNSEDWENKTLPEYLKAIASWTDDMDGYYINNNLPIPDNVDWKVFADILLAAKMYE
ncbi:DUF7660 family protein [Pedobacter sp.]|uniref:DUF7660 family protein n=1 Tax=Pedobacter sp. TaxID=1411316 RepID=UPI002C3973F5|nr:hypothetical protein [Pedobacter sp.]HWW38554.1 hypothetical protein [Pedobacter sp.]